MKKALCIGILLILISCGDKQEQDQDVLDKKQITGEIKQMLSNYHADVARDGLTAEFKYLDQSSDFYWVPPGYKSALNYNAVRTILEQNAKSLRKAIFHWDTLQIFPLSNDLANYTGIVNGFMVDTAGIESNISIIESGTIIKRKDGWKLLSGQSAVLKEIEDGEH